VSEANWRRCSSCVGEAEPTRDVAIDLTTPVAVAVYFRRAIPDLSVGDNFR
jgi:hypothetical protein